MIKFSKTPINQSELEKSAHIFRVTQVQPHLALFVVNHDIMWLDISMHNTLAVAVVQGLKKLEYVKAYVIVGELGIQVTEIGVVDILKYERGGLALRSFFISRCDQGERVRGSTQSPTQSEPSLTWLSRTTSSRDTMFGPPERFWRILISRFIFFFFTGFSTLMTHFW